MMISLEILQAACPQTPSSKLELYVEPLNAAMAEFDINTDTREQMFLAQLLQESGCFNYMEELASGAAYEGRADLGNTKPEAVEIAARHGSTPGRFFKGHGPIEITGYDNHYAARDALGIDCVENPKMLDEPIHGLRAAALYWKKHGCNELADAGDFPHITRRINGACTDGPPSHQLRRVAFLEAIQKAWA